MATVQEMMMDAAASIETAAMMSAGDTFEGNLSNKFDEDWIRIEMSAGMIYTINLSGRGDMESAVPDTFLRLYDSKGGLIKQNDDVDGAMGDLNSSFQFIPEVDGTYYISAGAYTGNPEHDTKGDDTYYGGAGSDMIYADNDDATINGWVNPAAVARPTDGVASISEDGTNPVSDDNPETNGAAGDTFVFGMGDGSDVIVDFVATDGDMLDLRAFGLSAEELTPLISVRAGNTILNLEDHGGGRITIQDVADLDVFEVTGGDDISRK